MRSKKPRRKMDVSKVQCFNCRKMEHYVVQCPDKHEKEKEKKKHHAYVEEAEEHSKASKDE
jgi:hypothetical protein